VAVAATVKMLSSAHLYTIKGAGHFFPDHREQMQQALLADLELPGHVVD